MPSVRESAGQVLIEGEMPSTPGFPRQVWHRQADITAPTFRILRPEKSPNTSVSDWRTACRRTCSNNGSANWRDSRRRNAEYTAGSRMHLIWAMVPAGCAAPRSPPWYAIPCSTLMETCIVCMRGSLCPIMSMYWSHHWAIAPCQALYTPGNLTRPPRRTKCWSEMESSGTRTTSTGSCATKITSQRL